MELQHSHSPNHIHMEDVPLKMADGTVTSDNYISEPEEEIDLFCSETIGDLDEVWEEGVAEGRTDVFKINPYQIRPMARRKLANVPPNSPMNPNTYRVGESPEENPYISYLLKEFNTDSEENRNSNMEDVELSDSELDTCNSQEIVDSEMLNRPMEMTEPLSRLSPLQERLTMVDSFNETSISDVIIFRDDSLTPYLERSPRSSNSPSLNGSQSDIDSPRSLSPFSDHVVPSFGEEARIRIMRSCDTSDDHIVPEFLSFIEE
ncbi:hypothetical protein SNE40_010915 [Patella caerulea]|uniref:Uncharacterized protein n=1 Tax=Patella caerulea TaxID=87958 RepID=A0AAN8Q0S3_PATCE